MTREQYHKRQPGRVLRPHRDWLVLDFVVGAIGAVFLGIGAWGVAITIGTLADMSALSSDCSQNACTRTATLVDRQRTYIPGGGLWGTGPRVDYCVVTLDLDSQRHQAAILGSVCPKLTVPSSVSADVWRGRIVVVHTSAGSWITHVHPSLGLVSGLIQMLALLPFGLCLLIIEFDVMNHRPVWRVHHRLFAR